MKYLTKVVETYRVDTEGEAKKLIEDAKNQRAFTLVKYTSEHKERKAKGEIIDEYELVSLTKAFNDVKEPDTSESETQKRKTAVQTATKAKPTRVDRKERKENIFR
jgi:hypothetical protein